MLVTSVPLDFSLSAAYTVRVMEGFSEPASREGAERNPLPGSPLFDVLIRQLT
jgi:hypothetical protein